MPISELQNFKQVWIRAQNLKTIRPPPAAQLPRKPCPIFQLISPKVRSNIIQTFFVKLDHSNTLFQNLERSPNKLNLLYIFLHMHATLVHTLTSHAGAHEFKPCTSIEFWRSGVQIPDLIRLMGRTSQPPKASHSYLVSEWQPMIR